MMKILSLLTLLSIIFITSQSHASPTLDPRDLKALSSIFKDLGIISTGAGDQRFLLTTNPCKAAGVFCETRLTHHNKNNSYVLKVTRLLLKSRGLDGFLSPAIGNLSELRELSVSHNNISDQIPPEIVQGKKLQVLDLRNNLFSGAVPSNLSSLKRLRVLDLSSNKFTGDLSNFLNSNFPNLESLSLANNLFSGKTPSSSSIRLFPNLRFFDFSGNSFIEDSAPLMYPKRYIFTEISAPAPAPSKTRPTQLYKHRMKLIGLVLGFLVGVLPGSFIAGFIFNLAAIIRGRVKNSGPAIFSVLIKNAKDLAFLQTENGLSGLEIIGKGGCGEVYKAELPNINGKAMAIAIKKIIQPRQNVAEMTNEESKRLNDKLRQIRSEITTVGHIRHRNLVPLLAHVSRPDCHYLVYEFMNNGSLQDILEQVSKGTRELDWAARLKIAIGVAAGLEYLHEHHKDPIIHRDLKPANILIDNDMEARITDFGLAEAIPDANTHVTFSVAAGTIGYIAPEYHQLLMFTAKCDVFSFGVILGVLVIGKFPTDDFFLSTEEMALVWWMRNIVDSRNFSEAIDPKLLGMGYDRQMIEVLRIAKLCTLENPKDRPSSKVVRSMLSRIRDE